MDCPGRERVAFPRTDRADVLYYAGHNCVLPKPRDRQLPADVWVPLRDVLARERAISPGRFTAGLPSPFPPIPRLVLVLLLSTVGDDDHRASGPRRRDVS